MWRSLVVVMAVTGAASAQPGAEPSTPPAPPPPAPAPAFDPAWAEYDQAFDKAAAGQTTEASAQLATLATKYPGHPAALRAGTLVRASDTTPAPKDPNAPSKLARGELVFWSTLGGISVGANVCVMVECNSERAGAAVFMTTVGGSLAASLLLTRKGVRNGQAQLYNSAQSWGAWNGMAINDGFAETSAEAGTALAAHAAGLGAGLVLWESWRPTEGDVALTNTFLVWGSVLTVFGHLAADAGNDLSFRRIVIAGDVALVAGALMSTQIKMSRGRTFLIDIGGLLGAMGGGLVALSTDSEQGAGTALLIGTAAGLAAGVGFSKDWDAPKLPVSPAPIAGPQSTGIGLATFRTF